MPSLSDKDRTRIAKLIGDPRYWNKSHPEHAQIFADAQRAFNDAYPDAPADNQASSGTVHVRAYTRMQDGKEVEVSAYDRRQEVAFHPPALQKFPSPNTADEISSSPEHDYVQALTMLGLAKAGARVAANVRVRKVSDGLLSVPDIIAVWPDGRRWAIEVKTGDAKWTKNQPEVYPLMEKGYEVYSDDDQLQRFGFRKGERLPPFEVYVAYTETPDGQVRVTPLSEAPLAPGKRLDDGHKGLK